MGPSKGGLPKGGAPNLEKVERGAQKGGAPKGGGPKFRAFFPSSATIFILLSLSWGSFRGILVVFEAPWPSNVHVWALGLSWAVQRRVVRQKVVQRFTGGEGVQRKGVHRKWGAGFGVSGSVQGTKTETEQKHNEERDE